MIDLLTEIFGVYTPITYSMTSTSGAAIEVIPSGLAGVDIPWLSGVLVFTVFMYCVFRIIGGISK